MNKKDGNFDHMAEDYDEKATQIWKHQIHVVKAMEQRFSSSHSSSPSNTNQQTLLELGCGTGNICLPLAKHLKHVYGVDISANMLSKAQEKIQRSSISNASVQHMDLTTSQQLIDCGFPEQYDWIMCCMTLHHLQDPMGKLELLKELLKPRGTLVIVEFGSNTSTGSAHSHAHHGHAHQHHHTQLSQQDREQGRHSDHRSSSNHGEDSHHDHAHAHAHSHHNPNDGESAKDATSHSNTKNEYKEKYGIFSDGFSSETLQQAFRKLGLSHCDVHELPSPEGLDEAHPFYGFPVMILFASSS